MKKGEMTMKIGYDGFDNACHNFLEMISGENLAWNVEAYGEVRDAVVDALKDVYGIELELIDDSLCAKAEEGKIPIVVVKDEKNSGASI